MTPNPWGLVATEFETLAALIEHGTDKALARKLDLHSQTVGSRVKSARSKMEAVVGKPLSRLQAAVLLDRFMRGDAT